MVEPWDDAVTCEFLISILFWIQQVFCATLTHAADQSAEDYKKLQEELEPPKPYRYAFTAGRFPGDIDRTHAEYGDGTGVVRGNKWHNTSRGDRAYSDTFTFRSFFPIFHSQESTT